MATQLEACGQFWFWYWNARYGSVEVLGVMIRMIRSNSFIMETKISMKPEIKPPLDRGNTILTKRLKKPAPSMVAASSSSPLICSMLEVPAREAKGRCLTTEVSVSRAKVPYRAGMSVTPKSV